MVTKWFGHHPEKSFSIIKLSAALETMSATGPTNPSTVVRAWVTDNLVSHFSGRILCHSAPETKELAQTLIDGLKKTFQNADELYDEALYLAEKGAVARALLLHQISLEECGKADLLCASVFALLSGEKVDMKRLRRVFSRHEAKNKANAYFLPKSEAEVTAEKNNDTHAANVAFKGIQDRFHRDSNNLKNASLYVDFDGGFRAPRDVITGEDLADIQQRNAEFVSMTHHKVSVLTRWTDLDAAAGEVAQISAVLGIDALDRSNPQTLRDFMDSLPARLVELARLRKPLPSE